MKKLLLALLLSTQLFAVGVLSTIGESEQDLLNSLLTGLKLEHLSDKQKEEFYDSFSFSLDKDWYAKWNSNSTASSSKVGEDDTQFIDLTVIDENRVYNITFIHFSDKKQLMVAVKQYVVSDSKTVLKINSEFKANDELEQKVDKDHYAYYSKKGYMNDKYIYVDGSEGMVVYSQMQVLDF